MYHTLTKWGVIHGGTNSEKNSHYSSAIYSVSHCDQQLCQWMNEWMNETLSMQKYSEYFREILLPLCHENICIFDIDIARILNPDMVSATSPFFFSNYIEKPSLSKNFKVII